MNKPYFTKWIAVEGEIKKGDKALHNGRIINILGRGGEDNNSYRTDGLPEWGMNLKKVKLFLCSRDIQVDDKVKTKFKEEWHDAIVTKIPEEYNDYETYYVKSALEVPSLGMFTLKVIGEISEYNSWVKEGMEFSEDEVAYCHSMEDNPNEFILLKDWPKWKKEHKYLSKGMSTNTIHMRCPTCGDFH